jgi:hypothetical protein
MIEDSNSANSMLIFQLKMGAVGLGAFLAVDNQIEISTDFIDFSYRH